MALALSHAALRRPRTAIGLGLLLVGLAASGLPRLEIRTDGSSLVPLENEQVTYSHHVRDTFRIYDQFVVIIRSGHEAGIFNAATLELVRTLTAEISALDGLDPDRVTSLATERGDRVVPGTANPRTYLEPLPREAQEIDRLREDLRRVDLYSGTVVSRDETAAAIFVGVPPAVDRAGLVRRLDALIETHAGHADAIAVVGGPVAEALLGAHIMDDLGIPDRIAGPAMRWQPDDRGWPRSFHDVRRMVARTPGLLPLAIAAMGLILLAFFRRVAVVALALGEVGACLLFVLGLMGWLGVPIYLTISVMPVILTAVGIADEIHILYRYRQTMRGVAVERWAAERTGVITATMNEMTRPIAQTSLTTAIGFLSFALSPIGAVQAFGVFTAVGVLFCLLWSLTVVPACLALVHPRRVVVPVAPGGEGSRGSGAALAGAIVRHRRLAVVVAVVLVAMAPFGVRRIIVQDSWIGGFAPQSVFYRDTMAFNENFLGSHILLVTVDTGQFTVAGEVDRASVDHFWARIPARDVDDAERLLGARIQLRSATGDQSAASEIVEVETAGDEVILRVDRHTSIQVRSDEPDDEPLAYVISPRRLSEPEVVERLDALETFIEGHAALAVGGVLGPGDYLGTTNFLLSGRQEKFRRLPKSRDRAELVWWHLERLRDLERRRSLVDDGLGEGVVTVFLTEPDFRLTSDLIDEIRSWEREHLTPHGIELDFAGDVAVSQTLIEAIVSTQVRSLLLSLVGILIVTMFLGRSVFWGACCVLPCALAVLINFAVLGATGVPLGVATSMFAGMTLGIGVDYAIHLMARHRHARANGLVGEAAVIDAMTATGPAIAIDALAIAAGFGVLVLSLVPANVRLGAFLALSVLGCLLATLVLLPALLSVRRVASGRS